MVRAVGGVGENGDKVSGGYKCTIITLYVTCALMIETQSMFRFIAYNVLLSIIILKIELINIEPVWK